MLRVRGSFLWDTHLSGHRRSRAFPSIMFTVMYSLKHCRIGWTTNKSRMQQFHALADVHTHTLTHTHTHTERDRKNWRNSAYTLTHSMLWFFVVLEHFKIRNLRTKLIRARHCIQCLLFKTNGTGIYKRIWLLLKVFFSSVSRHTCFRWLSRRPPL